tara:strand:- start:41 stop:631 length:591 start_codon:yes stop_codon:yes gene_type:complete
MNFKIYFNKLFLSLQILSILFFFNQCGIYKKTDARVTPTNAKDRAQKNIEEGKSVRIFDKLKGGAGTFEFASSNEMWRATIEILDFVPLTSADYGGGIVITDWYADTGNEKESIKIMVQFLSNEVRADGIKVIVYNKFCSEGSNNCQTNVSDSTISEEIKLAILKRASIIKNQRLKKQVEEYRKENPERSKATRKY